MNDDDLKNLLSAWRLPEVSETVKSQAKWQSLVAFQNRDIHRPLSLASAQKQPWKAFPFFKVGVPVFCLAAIFFLVWLMINPDSERQNALLQELEILFPGQIEAVIKNGEEIELRLADTKILRPADQRVAVRIIVQNKEFQILTYSGVAVCVESSIGTLCLTPLINGAGRVLLLSENGLFENQPGLQVEAHTLQDI